MDLSRILLVILGIAFVILFGGLIMEALYYAVLVVLVIFFVSLILGLVGWLSG